MSLTTVIVLLGVLVLAVRPAKLVWGALTRRTTGADEVQGPLAKLPRNWALLDWIATTAWLLIVAMIALWAILAQEWLPVALIVMALINTAANFIAVTDQH
jgi:hypothetical protein